MTLKIRFENYQSVLSIFCAEQCSCILLRFSLFLRTTPFNIACLHAGCLSLSWCRLFAPREHARHASLEVLAPKVTGEKLSLQVCKGLSPSCHWGFSTNATSSEVPLTWAMRSLDIFFPFLALITVCKDLIPLFSSSSSSSSAKLWTPGNLVLFTAT